MVLCGCSTWSQMTPGVTQTDWIDYANSMRAVDIPELERQYVLASREYAAAPSSETAIKLALLVADPRAGFYNADRATRLLDDAVSRDIGNDASTSFAIFMRGLIAEFSTTRATLVAERQLRQTLQGQLDALKALEERLNAEKLGR